MASWQRGQYGGVRWGELLSGLALWGRVLCALGLALTCVGDSVLWVGISEGGEVARQQEDTREAPGEVARQQEDTREAPGEEARAGAPWWLPCGGIAPFPADFLELNLPTLKLRVWRGGEPAGYFPVAIGSPRYETPTGVYWIAARRLHPTWYPPEGGAPVPPGPRNPLGSRFLALNLPLYGIHGTNDAASIGKAVSRGCIRLREEDIRRLWRFTYPGMPVRIFYERLRVEESWWGLSFYLYPDPYGKQPLVPSRVIAAGGCWLEGELALLAEALAWAERGPALLVIGETPRSGGAGGRGVGFSLSN